MTRLARRGARSTRRPPNGPASRCTDRVALVPADEHVDRVVEGGGEEERLALGRRLVEQSPDLGEEAHVGHAVGLVDDDDVDAAEVDVALTDEVGQAAGAGDDDVDATAQRLALSAEADAAVARNDPDVRGRAEPLELTLHLGGELPGRDEHERLSAAGLARRAGR